MENLDLNFDHELSTDSEIIYSRQFYGNWKLVLFADFYSLIRIDRTQGKRACQFAFGLCHKSNLGCNVMDKGNLYFVEVHWFYNLLHMPFLLRYSFFDSIERLSLCVYYNVLMARILDLIADQLYVPLKTCIQKGYVQN